MLSRPFLSVHGLQTVEIEPHVVARGSQSIRHLACQIAGVVTGRQIAPVKLNTAGGRTERRNKKGAKEGEEVNKLILSSDHMTELKIKP
jgi:hypothetical protein